MQHILLRQAHQLRVFVSPTDLLQVSLWYILASLHIHLVLCKFTRPTWFLWHSMQKQCWLNFCCS